MAFLSPCVSHPEQPLCWAWALLGWSSSLLRTLCDPLFQSFFQMRLELGEVTVLSTCPEYRAQARSWVQATHLGVQDCCWQSEGAGHLCGFSPRWGTWKSPSLHLGVAGRMEGRWVFAQLAEGCPAGHHCPRFAVPQKHGVQLLCQLCQGVTAAPRCTPSGAPPALRITSRFPSTALGLASLWAFPGTRPPPRSPQRRVPDPRPSCPAWGFMSPCL